MINIPLAMNKIPDTIKVHSNDPVISNSADTIGVPDNIPMPKAIADSPNALVNFFSPNNLTNTTGRSAEKNAEMQLTTIIYAIIFDEQNAVTHRW